MRGSIRKNKRIAHLIISYAPKWFVRGVIYLKGTGTLMSPKKVITPQNPHSLRCTIAQNKYGVFCTPDSCYKDGPVQEVYHGRQYEEETITFIKKLQIDGDIVHAGAYFGDMLPALSTCVAHTGYVWTFEPNKESYRCADITIRLNNLENVTLENIGLGKESDTLFLKSHGDNPADVLGGTSRIVSESLKDTYEVQVKKLDDMIPADRKISLLHIDVEGFEREVFEGAQRIIQKWSPMIIVEVNSPEITQYMSEIGYSFVRGLEQRQWREGFRNAVFEKSQKILWCA